MQERSHGCATRFRLLDFFGGPGAWRSGLCDPGGIFIVVVLIILVFVRFLRKVCVMEILGGR